ncbi:hypothetical protein [Catenovulum maritimum]|uniref:Uncharacterized protein n=1 Tax=Catenovulum maritimum TaxID=1513271 RepID=A0A0J8GVU4_9ALTE|nr:hypothetical protein [Catenovulum maritimum]KMT66877.1 hypothetical protein XM47_01880 [Catenovulum maritimum]
MEEVEFAKIVVPAVVGLISGAVGSLVAPWVNWRIEKKRKQIEYKHSLIKIAREKIDNAETIEDILSSSIWGFIDSNLTNQETSSISSGTNYFQTVNDGMTQLHMKKQVISKMLNRVEKQWGL